MAAQSVADDAKDTPVGRGAGAVTAEIGGQQLSPMEMNQFYQRLFPYKTYYQWLNYKAAEPTMTFTNREFSFTINNDIYLRYQSFKDCEEMRQEIIRLRPNKIDIGAVFTAKPKFAKSVQPGAFKPLEKELVFDIDMTDYDEIRTCCSGASICPKCWKFMIVAMRILDAALREDFGFENILWVYSGRRGIHCWVCDERARRLDDSGRKAIASYLTVVKGGAQQHKKVQLNSKDAVHPHITRSLEIAHEYFEEIVLNDQRVLDSKHTWDNVLKLIPDEGIRDKLDSMWQSKGSVSAIKKWEELEDALERKRGGRYLGTIVSEIVLQYLYPRLDENVTTHLNHLLKSPFCVHPKTGRVCTPIAPNQFESFDPFKVPTVPDLLNEINIYDQDAIEVGTGESQDMKVEEGKTGGGGARIPNYKKTSLRPYIETFEEFVKRLERNKVVKDPLSF